MSIAVIDLGSASTRMLICDESGATQHWQETTAMSQGLTDKRGLSADALGRVQKVLTRYREHCDAAEVRSIVAVATAAARQSDNSGDLVALVRQTLGVELEILSESREGELAFRGATKGVADDELVLVLDIGGASTEFVVGVTGAGAADTLSVPIGAVLVTEAYIESDPPDPAELSSALSVVSSHVEDAIRLLPTLTNAAAYGTVIGVGGTLSTTAAVEIGLQTYDRSKIQDFVLERAAVEDVFRTLATEDHEDRAFNPGLPADRVPYIVGGLCVLTAILRHLVISEIIVSEDDLLDGLLAELQDG